MTQSRLGPAALTASTVPFLCFHLVLYAMLLGIVPGFWSAFPVLVVAAIVLAIYGVVMPIRWARAARATMADPSRTWLVAQAITLACWLSGFVVWSVADLPVPDGP